MLEKIDSIKDPRIVRARALNTAQGRLESSEFLLEGIEHIKWAVEAYLSIHHLFVWEKYKDIDAVQSLIPHVPCFSVSEGILKKITDTSYVIPCVAVASKPQGTQHHTPEMVIVLDHLVDHGNIGTIIRSAAAFGIQDIISTSTDADFLYKKIIDASRGKTFQAHITSFSGDQEAIQHLKERGYQIVTTSPHAKTIQSLATLQNKPVALVLGNETEGCSPLFIEKADLVVQIPMHAAVESLNVAVAAGISMYELTIKLVIAMLIQKIHKNLGRQFGVTHALIRQALDAALLKVTDLDSLHLILLMILKSDQTMSFKQVAQDMGLCYGTQCDSIKEFLQPLLADGYIHIDDTKKTVQLTKSGEECIAKLWPVIEKTETSLLQGFSDLEKAQLLEYMTRIQHACTNIIESKD